jgi:hypothetical protein
MENFIVAVIASILATIIVILSRKFWVNIWFNYFRKIYPNITGCYEIILGDIKRQKPWFPNERAILDLKQFGKSIRGKYKFYSGSDLKLVFDIKGFTTTDKTVVLNYFNSDSRIKGAGALVMKIVGVKMELAGNTVYVCSDCEAVHIYPFKLKKVNNA